MIHTGPSVNRPLIPTTHHTALVVIPPPDAQAPIQVIRRRHDRHVHRWMPHITLCYPFSPVTAFDTLSPGLATACSRVMNFTITLQVFRYFSHGRNRFTLWLAPEPAAPLVELRAVLIAAAGIGVSRSGPDLLFVPHLSVGQVRGRSRLEMLTTELQAAWRPLTFPVAAVSLIRREDPPDDVFRIDRVFNLGE